MNFTIKNRYSDTDKSDKKFRWSRLVYANEKLIARINRHEDSKGNFYYHVSDFFPSIQSDKPCFSEVSKNDYDTVVESVKVRFNKFISNIIYAE